MIIKIKNNYLLSTKILLISYATSAKNNKNYLIIEVDATNKEQSKIFIEIADENEFQQILSDIANQMK